MGDMTVYGGPALEESVSAVTTDPSVDLGQRRTWKGEEYVYCYNAGGTSVNVEYGVKIVTGASGYSVAGTGLTDVQHPFVGIMKHATLTTGAYGWVMVKGWNAVNTGNSTITGDFVQLGGAVGVANKGLSVGLASGPGTNAAIGFALGCDTASGGSAYAFIKTGF